MLARSPGIGHKTDSGSYLRGNSRAASLDSVDHSMVRKNPGDRLVSPAQPLSNRLDVRGNTFLFPGVERPRSPHAGHDLVQDQERSVFVAYRLDRLEISGNGRHTSQRLRGCKFGSEDRIIWVDRTEGDRGRRRTAPTTVSATNAHTVLGPTFWNSSSSSCANLRTYASSVSSAAFLPR